jgi:non-ribosomal peptide synthetase component E (peptide arylation enzyme)
MTWRSRYEPVPVGGTTFHELVDERFTIIDGATGAETAPEEGIDRAAAALAARGFSAGDVLALQAPNGAAFVQAALGAMRLGGAVTGVPITATAADVERQLADAGAALLMTADGTLTAGRRRGPRPAWRCSRTRAAPAACRRASCSRTPTS